MSHNDALSDKIYRRPAQTYPHYSSDLHGTFMITLKCPSSLHGDYFVAYLNFYTHTPPQQETGIQECIFLINVLTKSMCASMFLFYGLVRVCGYTLLIPVLFG